MESASKFITRNVRDKPRTTLERKEDSDSDGSDDSLSDYDDTFRKYLDDDEDSQEYTEEEIEKGNKENERIMYHTLGDVLSVIKPDVDNHLVDDEINIISWDGNDRTKLGQSPDLELDEDAISDIYHLYPKGLSIDTNWTVKMNVKLPTTVIPCTELFHFFLLVKVNAKWQRIESQYNESGSTIQAKFTFCVIDDITAITKRISEIVNVTKDGYNFISTKDSNIQVDFPEGSVDNDKEFEFQVIPIDLQRFKAYKAYNPRVFNCLHTMSDVLSVKYDHNRNFNKDVRVQLPVIDTTDTNGIPLFVQFNGNEVEIQHDILSELDSGVYSTAVEHFSDVVILRVDPSSSESHISTVVSLVSGKEDYCTFITFATYQILKTQPSIWIECVDSLIADEIAKQRKRENKHLIELELSRSSDMSVLRKERVRIELGGNIIHPERISKDCFYMMYDKFAKNNHFTFPLVKRRSMSAPAYGAITYRCCRSQAHHVVHFDSDVPKKNLVQNDILSSVKQSNQPAPCVWKTVSLNNLQIPQQSTVSSSPTQLYQPETPNNSGERNNDSTIEHTRKAMINLSTPGGPSTTTANQNTRTMDLQYNENSSSKFKTYQQDPMFTDSSMLMLSQQFDDSFFNILSIHLGMKVAQINVIRSRAKENSLPGNLMILLEWLKTTAPASRVDLLKTAFEKQQRNDIVNILDRVKAEHREIGFKDF